MRSTRGCSASIGRLAPSSRCRGSAKDASSSFRRSPPHECSKDVRQAMGDRYRPPCGPRWRVLRCAPREGRGSLEVRAAVACMGLRMLKALGRFVLLVRDYDEALAFYRDILGFTTLYDQTA